MSHPKSTIRNQKTRNRKSQTLISTNRITIRESRIANHKVSYHKPTMPNSEAKSQHLQSRIIKHAKHFNIQHPKSQAYGIHKNRIFVNQEIFLFQKKRTLFIQKEVCFSWRKHIFFFWGKKLLSSKRRLSSSG